MEYKYENFLNELFSNKSIFIVGEELNALLQSKFLVSADNSRKIIQRAVAKGIIKTSAPLTFGKGQYVYFGSKGKLNKDNILSFTKKYRPPVYRLLILIDLNDGIISYYEALKIVSSPIEKSSTKVSTLEDIISDLKSINLIEIISESDIVYLIDINKVNDKSTLIKKHQIKMYLDSVFLTDILYWLQKHNLIDNSNIRYRNKLNPSLGVVHNNLVWDAFAYTKAVGIDSIDNRKDDKKTLVVLDVIVNREYTDEDLQGFFSRIQIVINNVKSGVRKIMPIIVSKDISLNLSNKIAKLGFIHLSLGTIFGEKIYEMISRLNIIKTDQISSLIDSEKFLENIEKILSTIRDTGQEINLENIKGDLFEALLYPLLKDLFSNSIIEQGKTIKDKESGEKYEYDFIIRSQSCNEIVIVEVKGYKSTTLIKLGDENTKNTVRWFFRRTFPFAQKYYNANKEENYPVKGCFITTAKFEPEAITVLEELNKGNIKPRQINLFYDYDELMKLANDKNMKKFNSIIKKYYLDRE